MFTILLYALLHQTRKQKSRMKRKPTVWTLRKVSTRISLTIAVQANPDGHFSPTVDFLFQEELLLYTSISLRRSGRPGLACRLICVDSIRRVRNVGFLVERLKSLMFIKLICIWFKALNPFPLVNALLRISSRSHFENIAAKWAISPFATMFSTLFNSFISKTYFIVLPIRFQKSSAVDWCMWERVTSIIILCRNGKSTQSASDQVFF